MRDAHDLVVSLVGRILTAGYQPRELVTLYFIVPAVAAALLLRPGRKIAAVAAAGVSGGALIYLAVFAAYYASCSKLIGPAESTILCTAWTFNHGAPLYPKLDALERVSLVYGPVQNLYYAGVLKVFGAGITASKVAAVALCAAGLACCFFAYRRAAGATLALLGLGYVALAYLTYGEISYYTRPDSMVIFVTSALLRLAEGRKNILVALAFGLLLGLGVNAKVHELFYAAPIAVLFVRHHGWRAGLHACAVAAVVAAAPFLVGRQISFSAYLGWLNMARAEGVQADIVVATLKWGALLFALPAAALAAYAVGNPAGMAEWLKRNSVFVAVLVVSAVVILRVAGKPGAGPAHLLPLVPLAGLVLVKALKRDAALGPWRAKAIVLRRAFAGIAAAVVFSMLICAIKIGVTDVYQGGSAQGADVQAEIAEILTTHPTGGIGMGVGATNEGFKQFRNQTMLVMAGHPYVIDVPAMMDMQKAGMDIPRPLKAYFARGECKYWLIPRGETPFALRSWYDPAPPMFDEEFRQIFLAHYRVVERFDHVDIWEFVAAAPGH